MVDLLSWADELMDQGDDEKALSIGRKCCESDTRGRIIEQLAMIVREPNKAKRMRQLDEILIQHKNEDALSLARVLRRGDGATYI
jgi:hypothetical protein